MDSRFPFQVKSKRLVGSKLASHLLKSRNDRWCRPRKLDTVGVGNQSEIHTEIGNDDIDRWNKNKWDQNDWIQYDRQTENDRFIDAKNSWYKG